MERSGENKLFAVNTLAIAGLVAVGMFLGQGTGKDIVMPFSNDPHSVKPASDTAAETSLSGTVPAAPQSRESTSSATSGTTPSSRGTATKSVQHRSLENGYERNDD